MLSFIRLATHARCLPTLRRVCAIKHDLKINEPPPRLLHISRAVFADEDKIDNLPVARYFELKKKNKETFEAAIEMFKEKDPRRRGHVEFITAALEYMEQYEVNCDLESYKNLIRVLPAGKFVPERKIQTEFLHFPKQQNCAVNVLDVMERNGVCPDEELYHILVARFGATGIPVRKYSRMMYWMPKFMNKNPWPVPRPTPKDAYTLAMLAIERIMSVDKLGVVSVLDTQDVPDSLDTTWIVSGQSPKQQKLLEMLPEGAAVYVEGPTLIWLRNMSVQYYTLRADPDKEPEPDDTDPDDVRDLQATWMMNKKKPLVKPVKSVHEQEDGKILGVCATGTSSKDSLLSWIRLLEKDNPRLASLPVLFRIRSSPKGEILAI